MFAALLSLIISLLLCYAAARRALQKRDLASVFWALLTGIWSYVSLLMLVFSLTQRLEILLFMALLPLFVIAAVYWLIETLAKRERLRQQAHEHVEENTV